MSELLKPSASLLCKLASLAVHADEYLSPGGHPFDADTIRALLADEEVKDWLAAMAAASLAPRKRSADR